MKNLFQNKFIYFIVGVISVLLAINIILTSYNNSIIKRNQKLQDDVAIAKIYYDQIGKSIIHSVDIGLRGYAIIRNDRLASPLDNARMWKDSILSNAERPLRDLRYEFFLYNQFKDSLNAFIDRGFLMKKLLQEGREQEFKKKFADDRGGHLWWMYLEVEKDIQQYINKIDADARAKYEAALFRNQILQIILFLICVPTLIYTAYYTGKTNRLSELLRKASKEKNRILREQNITLERKVQERTFEIADQNEKIVSQNKQLQEAGKTIETQNSEIQAMNQHLIEEVQNRTQQLQIANHELVDQNNQLEQFAFIAAHNLRAPLARILGLTNLMKISDAEIDKNIAFEKLIVSTQDLDHVIRDLNTILNIRKHTTNLTAVDLETSFLRVQRILETEIEESQTKLIIDFGGVGKILAVVPYVESIFYNLISNAIKYRDPERSSTITVTAKILDEFACLIVSDNGLGIDLKKYGSNVFGLYKRFHLHMEGKGLGLYLVKAQIEAVGGRIEIESEVNKGTTFRVFFKRP